MANRIVEVRNIVKTYGPTIALNDVSFDLETGNIIGLVGENGSGKSTVSSIIAGIQDMDKGSIKFKGKPWNPSSMMESLKNGIGMIVQENGTIPNITVAENIFLGETDQFINKRNKVANKLRLVDKKLLYEEANNALKNIGINHINASMKMATLNLQDRKLVEIAKTVYAKPDVLIVDETTTVLSQIGRDILYNIMENMKNDDKLVIFISHDLDEIVEKCSKLIVLRDGNLIVTLDKDEMDDDLIKSSMIGRELQGHYYRDDYECSYDNKVTVDVKNLNYRNQVKNVNFQLHKGEILGIGGLAHCGMHEIGKLLFSIMSPDSGEVTVNGKKIKNEKEAMSNKMGYVAKDRDTESLNLEASIRDNIAIVGFERFEILNGVVLPAREKKYVEKLVKQFEIKCIDMEQSVRSLSGGNKQKVVFSKWVGRGSEILVLDCPTRGVDIGVKQAMYQLMNEMKKQGKSILIISEELSELIGMSDRLLIMKDGAIAKEFERSSELSESDIISYMV